MRDRARKRAKSVDYLRLIEAHDDDLELSSEVEKKVDALLRDRSKRRD